MNEDFDLGHGGIGSFLELGIWVFLGVCLAAEKV